MNAISLLYISMPFIVMFGLGLLLPSLIILGYSNYLAGLIIIAFTFFLDAVFMGGAGLRLGLNLFVTDIGLLLVGIVVALRFSIAKDFPLRNRAWVLFSALVATSILLGLAIHGTAAGVQARPYFYFIVAGLYGMSFPMDASRIRQTLNVLFVIGGGLLVLTTYRWVVYYTPIYSLLPPGGTYNIDGPIRVIKSNETLLLVQVLVVGLFYTMLSKGARITQYATPLLLAFVVVLQHRSVWLAGLVGVLTHFLLARKEKATKVTHVFLLVMIVSVSTLPMVFSDKLTDVAQQVQTSTVRVFTGADTTSARIQNWRSTLREWYAGGAKSILVGKGVGIDTTRYVETSREIGVEKIRYHAHNMYVQTLYNFGLLGLITLLIAYAYVVVGLYKISCSGKGGKESHVLLVLMAMQLAYYIPYGVDYIQSLIFGVALSYVALHKQSHASQFSATAAR